MCGSFILMINFSRSSLHKVPLIISKIKILIQKLFCVTCFQRKCFTFLVLGQKCFGQTCLPPCNIHPLDLDLFSCGQSNQDFSWSLFIFCYQILRFQILSTFIIHRHLKEWMFGNFTVQIPVARRAANWNIWKKDLCWIKKVQRP